jgi:hypothetical protein
LKADLFTVEPEACGNGLPAGGRLLPGERLVVDEVPRRRGDVKGTAWRQRDCVSAAVGELNLARIGAGPDVERVLEVAVGSGELEVDAGPEIAIDDARVGRESGTPLLARAAKVTHLGGGGGAGLQPRVGIGALEEELDGGDRIRGGAGRAERSWLAERVVDRGGSEPGAGVAALNIVSDLGRGLSLVLDEVDGQVERPRTEDGAGRNAGKRTADPEGKANQQE